MKTGLHGTVCASQCNNDPTTIGPPCPAYLIQVWHCECGSEDDVLLSLLHYMTYRGTALPSPQSVLRDNCALCKTGQECTTFEGQGSLRLAH